MACSPEGQPNVAIVQLWDNKDTSNWTKPILGTVRAATQEEAVQKLPLFPPTGTMSDPAECEDTTVSKIKDEHIGICRILNSESF